MRVLRWLMTGLVASAAACAQPTPEQRIINDAAQALGGRDRVLKSPRLRSKEKGGSSISARTCGPTPPDRPSR